jgi:tetratricopeptide (TPR) repeat protein
MELLNQKNQHRAKLSLRNSLTIAPLCVEGNLMLANLLCQGNHAHNALAHVERAAPNIAPARYHFERGKVQRAAMDLTGARESFYQALKEAPDNALIAASLVGALEMAGHLKEAGEVCAAARAKFPNYGDLRRQAAVIAAAQGDHAGAVELLDDSAEGAPPLVPTELLDKGRALEKLGRYAEAWILWHQAKTTLREQFGHIYNAEQFARNFAGLRDASVPPRPNFVRPAPDLDSNPGPLFVCGYPRSGTTLTESIFAAHSAVVAGDELNSLIDVIEALPPALKVRVPYPQAMLASSLGENATVPEMLRDRYLKTAQERIGFKSRRRGAGGVTRPKPIFFTDKMPLNELHLPLIRMLFPAAPVFRLQRHPLDVMVSCMSNWLVHGGFYASSLEICAKHYRDVWELTKHHERQFAAAGKPAFVTVRYESLAERPEENIPILIVAAGLDMEEACKSPHRNNRTARTLSYRQVQAPINRKGLGRWKNFREQLAPAVEILRPILEAEGYDF